MDIKFEENEIYVHIHVNSEGDVRLYHLGADESRALPEKEEDAVKYRLVEVHESGGNQNDHHGRKHTGSSAGLALKYKSHQFHQNETGLLFELSQSYKGLLVSSFMQFYKGLPVVRTWSRLKNEGEVVRNIEYVSSFTLTGITGERGDKRAEDAEISIPHSSWYGEALWRRYTPAELGYHVVNDFSMKRILCGNTGTWASGEYLPMGAVEDLKKGNCLLWQIETHGSWHWEISDVASEMYLHLYGPTFQESGFLKMLKPGEEFESVPAAVCALKGDFEKAVQVLTSYRRIIRRPNEDNRNPEVIFNDYMNCLNGDPTTEKLIPLIDTAARSGCRYFCIDAGWYDDGPWWDGVGQWLPAQKRFPGGIQEPLDRIRSKGMIPGLWLELEVMGINCPLVGKVPEQWFFIRNGKPVIDEGRYQLDYRNPEVRAYADSIIKRVVEEYGVGYIKMDYNINAGVGTELDSDSAGEGLLEHTRAYVKWLDSVFERYPSLVIENCSSGGMRMTWSLLARQSIQSVSDQTDYLRNAVIAVNCPTAVTPEQAAIWSYPLKDGDVEETVLNMVNALLLRVHMSGHIANLSEERLAVVQEGIAYHHKISSQLNKGFPFWPLGLADMDDEVLSLGMDCGSRKYLAIWNLKGERKKINIPLPGLKGLSAGFRCSYPEEMPVGMHWNEEGLIFELEMPSKAARIFEIDLT